jgi:uncharacterized protein (DUF2249 family)
LGKERKVIFNTCGKLKAQERLRIKNNFFRLFQKFSLNATSSRIQSLEPKFKASNTAASGTLGKLLGKARKVIFNTFGKLKTHECLSIENSYSDFFRNFL